MNDCIFCKIVAGALPATIVHRDEHMTAFRDLHPMAPTHILLVPNRHITSVDAAAPEDAALLGHLLVTAGSIARGEGLQGGYRLVVNTGRGAGQSVFHLHVHLLGGRRLGWPPG